MSSTPPFAAINGESLQPQEPEQSKFNLTLLLIDHYDSFTYNLYDMLAQLTLEPPLVLAKDAYDSWPKEVFDNLDGIILSPGPGTPQAQPPFSKQAIHENPDLPLLGVCLGHQLLALEYGGDVGTAPTPIHGQDHRIYQIPDTNSPIFEKLPASWRVVRYHSLAAKPESLPACLQVTAYSEDDNVIQGLSHTKNPHYGVQFHPESIGTEYGFQLLENFCNICQDAKNERTPSHGELTRSVAVETPDQERVKGATETRKDASPRHEVYIHKLHQNTTSLEPEQVFEEFYGTEQYAMWLDSCNRGNISILAAPTNDDAKIEYVINSEQDQDILSWLQEQQGAPIRDVRVVGEDQSSFDIVSDVELDVPFDYRGGSLGYLGYGVRQDTKRYLGEQERAKTSTKANGATPSINGATPPINGRSSKLPTAVFFLAERSMVYHHPTNSWYLIGVSPVGKEDGEEDIFQWMQDTSRRLKQLDQKTKEQHQPATNLQTMEPNMKERLAFVPNRPRETYERNIAECLEQIRLGESYELCLTNQLEAKVDEALSPFQLYQILRRRNPAPYSAFFSWNIDQKDASSSSWSICCSSPERFISVLRRPDQSLQAEAKPIKGTTARVLPKNGVKRDEAEEREDSRRARALELSIKDRAENLMIVDLLRNDMSRVCEIGSVHVAKLMAIESYATVHQMVSTIRGTLDSTQASSVDLLKACFPGGSMTGAPKLRTTELLEEMEEQIDRGPYSGSLGYLSLNGSMDMNIIIRTAVVEPLENGGRKVSIGAGGAITALSDATDEYEEMLLKASAVIKAVQEWAATAIVRDHESPKVSVSSPAMESSSASNGSP